MTAKTRWFPVATWLPQWVQLGVATARPGGVVSHSSITYRHLSTNSNFISRQLLSHRPTSWLVGSPLSLADGCSRVVSSTEPTRPPRAPSSGRLDASVECQPSTAYTGPDCDVRHSGWRSTTVLAPRPSITVRGSPRPAAVRLTSRLSDPRPLHVGPRLHSGPLLRGDR